MFAINTGLKSISCIVRPRWGRLRHSVIDSTKVGPLWGRPQRGPTFIDGDFPMVATRRRRVEHFELAKFPKIMINNML
jgi:hypothetical protein